MTNRVSESFALLGALLLSCNASGIELTTGRDGPQQLAQRGQSPSGCPDTEAKGRFDLSGEWLSLTDTSIQSAKPFVLDNKITSSNSDEKYFVAGIPLRTGTTPSATVRPRQTGTTARTQYDIQLGPLQYRFIEWGAFAFALKRRTSSGAVESTEVYTLIDDDGKDTIPKYAYAPNNKPRTNEDPGILKLLRAGDFNGDGVVDLLLYYESKEAGGLILWLSDPASKKHVAPIIVPTWYGDC
jgi:hypothetical protein